MLRSEVAANLTPCLEIGGIDTTDTDKVVLTLVMLTTDAADINGTILMLIKQY
jgi:hypothetical protein